MVIIIIIIIIIVTLVTYVRTHRWNKYRQADTEKQMCPAYPRGGRKSQLNSTCWFYQHFELRALFCLCSYVLSSVFIVKKSHFGFDILKINAEVTFICWVNVTTRFLYLKCHFGLLLCASIAQQFKSFMVVTSRIIRTAAMLFLFVIRIAVM